jgi:hypothetical protein
MYLIFKTPTFSIQCAVDMLPTVATVVLCSYVAVSHFLQYIHLLYIMCVYTLANTIRFATGMVRCIFPLSCLYLMVTELYCILTVYTYDCV